MIYYNNLQSQVVNHKNFSLPFITSIIQKIAWFNISMNYVKLMYSLQSCE